MSRPTLRLVQPEPVERKDDTGAAELPPEVVDVRFDLVARVRREIAEGQYDTPEKLESAVSFLLASESAR